MSIFIRPLSPDDLQGWLHRFALASTPEREQLLPALMRAIMDRDSPIQGKLYTLVSRQPEQRKLETAVGQLARLRFDETGGMRPFTGTATLVVLDLAGTVVAAAKERSGRL